MDFKYTVEVHVKEIHMKDDGTSPTEMEKEHTIGNYLGTDMKENGNLERNKDMEYFILQKVEISMKDVILKIKEMEKEFSIGPMEMYTVVLGGMEKSKEWEHMCGHQA